MKMTKKQSKIVLATLISILVATGGWIFYLDGPYSENINGSWSVLIYETENPIQDRLAIVTLELVADDVSDSVMVLAQSDNGSYIIVQPEVNMNLNQIPLRDRHGLKGDEAYSFSGGGSDGINMTYMHRYHFRIRIENSTGHTWEHQMNLSDHTNRYQWISWRQPFEQEIGYQYAIQEYIGPYTMQLRFMYNYPTT